MNREELDKNILEWKPLIQLILFPNFGRNPSQEVMDIFLKGDEIYKKAESVNTYRVAQIGEKYGNQVEYFITGVCAAGILTFKSALQRNTNEYNKIMKEVYEITFDPYFQIINELIEIGHSSIKDKIFPQKKETVKADAYRFFLNKSLIIVEKATQKCLEIADEESKKREQ